MKKKVANQRTEVLKHLKRRKSITSKEAFEFYGATRLAALIFDLRKVGYRIDTLMMEGKTRYGTPTQYAKYVYRGMEDK